MAYLYQLINNLQGLEGGNSYEKQANLFKKLGGQGNYIGNAAQNNWLLTQINNGSAQKAIVPQPLAQPVATAPQNPYDVLKQTALGNNLLKSEVSFESLNPFSKYFDENLFRNSLQQGVQPEIDRVTGNLNANDQSYRTTEAKTYDNNTKALNQNLANTGSFYGGVRAGQQSNLDTSRNLNLADYTRSFNDQMLNTQRNYQRTIEDQVAAEKTKKAQGYAEEKTNYMKNPNYQ